MRKFLSVLVAVTMCICLFVPAAFAADNSLSSLLEGVDLGSLTDGELSSILGGLNLEGVDIDSLKEAFQTGDSSTLTGLEDAIKNLGTDAPTSADASAASDPLGALSSIFGGMDMSWLTDIISDPSAITDLIGMFTGSDDGSSAGSGDSSSGFDLSAIMDMISGAFGDSGIDLGSLTGGMDLGSFDIGSLLGGFTGGDGENQNGAAGNAASGATDIVATIMDALKGGLEKLGLDSSMIEGLLDNDIVNFFANLYIGLGGVNEGGKEEPTETTAEATTKKPETTKKPTPDTPKTGDTSTVFVAIGTISVAAAAAFVCLKKKED